MSDSIGFDYYYGAEADQFSFIRIPKLIIVDPKFADLSLGAKMLYGMLLDRMNLSMKHGWMDEENRVYIRFKIGAIGEALAISEPTATKYLKELERIGLVEKKRVGMAIGNILYVKNFISPDLRDKALITLKNLRNGDSSNQTAFANITSPSTNDMSCDTDEASKYHIDMMPKHKIIMTGIRDQVNADELEERYSDSSENIRNIIDVMVEIMMSTRPTIMISGNEYDSYFVKSRVFCIFERHIEYMLECIKKNTTKVGNIKAYLRATVFNCTTTLGCYDDLTVQNLIAETYYA